jgi:hypothetical protein
MLAVLTIALPPAMAATARLALCATTWGLELDWVITNGACKELVSPHPARAEGASAAATSAGNAYTVNRSSFFILILFSVAEPALPSSAYVH